MSARDLDRSVRVQLKGLSKENAEAVARHLVMVGRLIESDPAEAHRHALAAAERAGRIAVVRETVGITAYEVGDFARALRELRTYRRISGRDDEVALMVDSERGVGRPDRALEIGRAVAAGALSPAVRVALAIAMSGARLDLGQTREARGELEIPQLDETKVFDYSPQLFDAYAEVLEELGDGAAAGWRRRAVTARSALYTASQAAADETVAVVDEVTDEASDSGALDRAVAAGGDRAAVGNDAEAAGRGPGDGQDPA
ncbi:MAG TPA: hypothetical protein VFQ96_05570 [Microbacteriaceae bacterium]|nr:hypothetical protein [Microbacteriaceae bacterium]